nr:hypothetical protein [Formosa sp. L2A11]
MHYNRSPEKLSVEHVQNYLYHCQKLHKTPSESFFKHTIFGLRAAYKVMGMEAKRVALPQIKRDIKLPCVLNKEEVKRLLKAPKYLKHRLIIGMLYGVDCVATNSALLNYLISILSVKPCLFLRKKEK